MNENDGGTAAQHGLKSINWKHEESFGEITNNRPSSLLRPPERNTGVNKITGGQKQKMFFKYNSKDSQPL